MSGIVSWSVGPGPNYIKTPFTNNQLPLVRESPLAKYMFGVTPSPTNNLSPLVPQGNPYGGYPGNLYGGSPFGSPYGGTNFIGGIGQGNYGNPYGGVGTGKAWASVSG